MGKIFLRGAYIECGKVELEVQTLVVTIITEGVSVFITDLVAKTGGQPSTHEFVFKYHIMQVLSL